MFNNTFPTLTTERLTLRQLSETDAPEIFLLRSDPTVNKYLGRQPSKTPEEALSFIKNVNKNVGNNAGCYWAITFTGSAKLVGTICLFDISDELKKCEIGYELLPDHQGQGIMQEALEKIIEFVFQTLGLDIIEAFTHNDNESSSGLLQKFNFKKISNIDDLLNYKLHKPDRLSGAQ